MTALDDRRELLCLRQGALQTTVAVGQLMLQAVDRLLVAQALDADPDGAGEVLPDARDALGGRVGKDDADTAVAAADRRGADPCKLFAADAGGGIGVDHEGLVLEVGELPAPGGLDRRAALVAGLDALLLTGHRLALEIVVHNRPPKLAYRRSYRRGLGRSL